MNLRQKWMWNPTFEKKQRTDLQSACLPIEKDQSQDYRFTERKVLGEVNQTDCFKHPLLHIYRRNAQYVFGKADSIKMPYDQNEKYSWYALIEFTSLEGDKENLDSVISTELKGGKIRTELADAVREADSHAKVCQRSVCGHH